MFTTAGETFWANSLKLRGVPDLSPHIVALADGSDEMKKAVIRRIMMNIA
jgi:hypothetical protein